MVSPDPAPPDAVSPGAGWTDACASDEIVAAPRALVVGGRPLVLYRTSRGRVVALDDACPHQGTELSLGTVVGDSIRCVRHGWEVGSDGWCDKAGFGTPAHRTREDAGRIWVLVR
jgi:phenylpropionate dioxygenase-like ring-hydroxylating dioxygenase large terminal subunit